jgi:hypothetical protein
MKNYALILSCGEVINKVRIQNRMLAVSYFAKVKNMPEVDLIRIFEVVLLK